jgi:hypothetical protein
MIQTFLDELRFVGERLNDPVTDFWIDRLLQVAQTALWQLSRRGFSGQVDQSKIGLPGEEDSCHARRGISHRSSEKKR